MSDRNSRNLDRMTSMKNATLALLVTLFAVGTGTALADDYPDGCVSCHVSDKVKPGSAYRLDLQLAKLGHGKGGERTQEVPTGCFRCHASNGDGAAGKLGPYIHVIHFQGGDKNPFLKKYGGDCSSCHRMDPATWRAVAKSGERNWDMTVGNTKIAE